MCWFGDVCVTLVLVSKSYEKQALKEKESLSVRSPRLDSTLVSVIIYRQAPFSVRDPSICLSLTPGNALLCQESVGYVFERN